MSDKNEKYLVPALLRGLDVLEKIAGHNSGVTLAGLLAEIPLPPASLYRTLCTLEHCGYVERENDDSYRISRKLLKTAFRGLGENALTEIAMPYMRQARDLSGETVLIGVLTRNEGVVLAQAESPNAVKVTVAVGHHFPLHSAAPGKVLLAHLPEDEAAAVMKELVYTPFTARTITTPEALKAELEKVRSLGTAVDNGEELSDLRCVAAPVFDRSGYPAAAVWISGPASRMDAAKIRECRKIIADCAGKISQR